MIATVITDWQHILADGVQITLLFLGIYGVLYFLRRTRGAQVFAGILIITVLFGMVIRIEALHLHVFNRMLDVLSESLFIALVIIFQPELRRALAQLGTLTAWHNSRKEEIIEAVVSASCEMARRKWGALIVIERDIKLQNYIDDAVALDAKVNRLMLESIFCPKAPLHDGAVIIRKDRIVGAKVILPLISSETFSSHLGTRHRAALGISEDSDAVTVVVSEETGCISLTYRGVINRDLTSQELESMLEKLLILKDDNEASETAKIMDDNVDVIAESSADESRKETEE